MNSCRTKPDPCKDNARVINLIVERMNFRSTVAGVQKIKLSEQSLETATQNSLFVHLSALL